MIAFPGGEVRKLSQNGQSPRVLVVDADADYQAVVARCAELAGAHPEMVSSLGNAVRRLAGSRFDLVVWGLAPGEQRRPEGVAQLHGVAGGAPLILLDESYEEAKGSFEAGADQVLPKPFVPGALVGAIKAGLRGLEPSSVIPLATRIDVRGIVFDSEHRQVSHGGVEVALTRREWQLLSFLLAKPNQFFPADELLRQAWRSAQHSPEQLRSYVARLRRKLAPLSLPCQIVSRQGSGYCLRFEAGP